MTYARPVFNSSTNSRQAYGRTQRSDQGYSQSQDYGYNRGYRDDYPPAEPVVETGPPREDYIVFKGKYYSLKALKLLLGGGVRIGVSFNELHASAATLVDYGVNKLASEHKCLAVTPYEGKLVIVAGHEHANALTAQEPDKKIKAMMIPNMLLKKAYIRDVQ